MHTVTLAAIKEARQRIGGVARTTPLVDVTTTAGRELLLKCESMQPGGAFKIRGAYNMVAQLPTEARDRGVITYSSGNHAQAVALAARLVNTPSVVVMPTTAPPIKIAGARGYGAEVLFAGTTSPERRARAEAVAADRGLTMVPPFDHSWIVNGQGTAGLEILDQRPDVAAIVVPIGGGGLVAGVAAAVKESAPHIKVIGVEPAGAAAMRASLDAGHAVTLARTASVADGLLPLRPGDLTFELVQRYVDDVVLRTRRSWGRSCGRSRRPRSSLNQAGPSASPPSSPAASPSTDQLSRSSAAVTSPPKSWRSGQQWASGFGLQAN